MIRDVDSGVYARLRPSCRNVQPASMRWKRSPKLSVPPMTCRRTDDFTFGAGDLVCCRPLFGCRRSFLNPFYSFHSIDLTPSSLLGTMVFPLCDDDP